MDNKKNNNGVLVGVLIGLVISTIVVVLLYVIGFISFKTNLDMEKTSNNTSYKVEDFIILEKVNIDDGITTNVEKVVFKNLDSSLTQNFIMEQTELIDSAKNTYSYFSTKFLNDNQKITDYYGNGKNYLAKSNIWYQINKNILTVHYELVSENEIGVGNSIAVINIDLTNKKVLTNEELLKLGNSSFNDIATKEYNRVAEECSKKTDLDYCYYNKAEQKVTLEEHKNNKNLFIKELEKKMDELIKVYIQDNKVKYDYNIGIRLVNETLYMGGPFSYTSAEVGEYK